MLFLLFLCKLFNSEKTVKKSIDLQKLICAKSLEFGVHEKPNALKVTTLPRFQRNINIFCSKQSMKIVEKPNYETEK